MRLTRSLYQIIFLLLVCRAAKAQPPSSDPIFGMVFDAKRVHFEKAAPAVVAQCKTLKELRTKPFWVFAHARIDGTDYFIISNETTEVSGAGLIMRGSECIEWLPESMIAGEATFDKVTLPKWAPLTDPVLKALSNDAFARYTQAYGGKKVFLDALHKGGLAPKELPKVLREELAVFSSQQ